MTIQLLSTKQIIVRISVIIAAVEFLIMLLLDMCQVEASKYTEAALDMSLLVLFSTPSVYFWVVRPFVKARDEAVKQASLLSLTDTLTQLPNRRSFLTQLEIAASNISRRKSYGAVMFIDLDGFKQVNDTYGHDAGDAVLICVSKRFVSATRSGDIVARMGGDEFIVLIDNLDTHKKIAQDEALIIAKKLISLAELPIEFNSHQLMISASIGVYILGFDPVNINIVISNADKAMYSAKKSGKGRLVIFES